MKRGPQPSGYTIIEVMIVMAVSALMFLAASTFISGKEASTSFRSGTNEMASRMQDLISQVSDGHYSDQGFKCAVVGGNLQFQPNTPGVSQGANPPCLFMGKLLIKSSTDDTKYSVASLAGMRLNQVTSKPVATIQEANPTEIKGGGVDLTVSQSVPQGLSIKNIKVDGSAQTNFGLAQGVGNMNGSSNYVSGGQSAMLITANGGVPINGGNATIAHTTELCLTDGARYAVLSIGLQSGQLSVNTQFYGATAC